MNHAERRILRNIVLAKVASDGAKGKSWLLDNLPQSLRQPGIDAYKAGYRAKDKFIQAALRDIAQYHPKTVHFFLLEDDRATKADKGYVVYFDINLDGERMQVSLHAFKVVQKWTKGNAASIGRWKENKSWQNCLKIAMAICGSEA